MGEGVGVEDRSSIANLITLLSTHVFINEQHLSYSIYVAVVFSVPVLAQVQCTTKFKCNEMSTIFVFVC